MTLRYLVVRLLDTVVVLAAMSAIIFVVVRVLPADPVLLMLGDFARPGDIEAMRSRLGLDRPLYVQYGAWMSDILRGDLGTSIRTGRPVVSMFAERLPASIQLTASALLLGVLTGLPLGVIAATRRDTMTDHVIRVGAVIANSTPNFFLGLLLILAFSVHLRALPSFGYGTWQHFVLPTITLSTFVVALVARITRASMLEVLEADYIRTARSKGLPATTVVVRHGLKNALIPVVTVIGLQLGVLVGGAIVTETVFAWPGIGTAVYQAISDRDYPVVQAVVLYVSIGVIIINTVTDGVYALLDPQVRFS